PRFWMHSSASSVVHFRSTLLSLAFCSSTLPAAPAHTDSRGTALLSQRLTLHVVHGVYSSLIYF
ncbi:hypothetical protein EXIGLDRAFT_720115, partial [Exidia glandulosa HHB12029]